MELYDYASYKEKKYFVNVITLQSLSTANTYHNMASVYHDIEENEKAAEFYYIALDTQENILGKEHPFMENIYDNIAKMHYFQGDYNKARDYFCRAAIVSIINNISDTPYTKPMIGNAYDCFIKDGGNEDDFEPWLKKRIATYPDW